MPSPVIDVHTHMFSRRWLEMLAEHGQAAHLDYKVNPSTGKMCIYKEGAPFMTPNDAMSDYDLRIRKMDEAGVDVAIVSLTCPNVFFGSGEVSLAAAVDNNDSMAEAKTQYPHRLRWFASLPWQYADLAVAELDRVLAKGASGVVVLGNIAGKTLTDEAFAPVWRAIDEKAVPVFIHPTTPPGISAMNMDQYMLTPPLGFTFDTSLAVARMVLDGFFDRHQRLTVIAGHGGGTIPYLIGRMDHCWDRLPGARERTNKRPSEYLRQVCTDTVVFRQDALEMCLSVFGEDNVMYGSDYPHHIGDMVGCLARVDALDGGRRDKVRGRNAERIFGL